MFQSDLFPAGEQLPSMPLAYAIGTRVAALLASGRHLTRTDISGLFAEETGVLDWGSAWTIDDYNSAVEIGALLWLRESSRIDLATNVHEAEARFDWLEAALPPRHVRSEAQVELQQFSTPPMLACLMAKAAAVCAQDTLLEPSAGNGALALWGCLQNASLLLNEIDPARRDGLAHVFPTATITAHDGELIADLLRGPVPSAVLMNPPFAHSLERGKDGETAMRHLRGAFRAAANRARIVAIMPEGFDASAFAKEQDEASLLLDVRLQQMFRRTGTGIAVRLVVFDKTPTASSPAITGDNADLISLHELITALPPRVQTSANIHRLPLGKPVRLVGKTSAQSAPVRPVAPFAATPAATANAIDLAYSVLADPAPVPEQTGIYLPYRPSRIAFEDAPVHPTPLVESVAMGSVAAPQPDVCPRIPAYWQADGLLSEAQCETLVYAAQAFARDLPGQFKVSQEGTSLELSEDGHSYRQGFFLGDGTGAGKGRQIAAVIMDRWLAGERRHVWITKNEALLEDARRDWEALGGLPLDLQPLSRWKLGQPVTMSEGILFVTYPTLRSGRAEDTRLDQILAWAGEDFDGVIAFDEAHAMANALGGSSIRGKVKGSEQGMAGLRLQNHLPRARVLYASATGASDIANLGYTSRLGLWGPETAFPTHEAFMTEIRAGGVAAMELVARDLKAQGLYLARALSFAGVEYEILEHSLTEAQIKIYDAYADAWAIIHRNLEAALEATRVVDEDSGDTLNRNAKAAALSIFEGTKQRFFAQLLLSMKLPSLIPAMEVALGEEHSVVVQLVSTAEAMLDRRLADLTVEEREALDIDLSPREYVIDYLTKSFPIRLMQVFADEDGNLRSEAMSDEEGNPVFCPRAIAARDALIEQLCALPPIDRFTVLADELLRTDPVIGAETRLVSLEVTRHLRPLRLKRLVRMHEIGSSHAIPMRNARSGKVALSVPTRRLITDDGAVIERRRLLRPLNSANWTIEALAESHWEEIGVTAFTRAWRAEEERAAKSPVTERVHLATGLLLPVWKRLPGDHVRVTRLVAEDGQSIIGREVLDIDLAAIAETFGLSGVTGPAPDQIGDLVLASGKPLGLASHDPLTVKRSLVGGEQRLELTGFSPDRLDWYKNKGCFTEIIRYRTRLFVPTPRASETLQSIAIKS